MYSEISIATQVVNSTMALHQAEQQIAADQHRIQDPGGSNSRIRRRVQYRRAEPNSASTLLTKNCVRSLLAAELKRIPTSVEI